MSNSDAPVARGPILKQQSGASPIAPRDNFAAFKRFIDFYAAVFAEPGLLADAECRQSYKEYVPDYYEEIFGPKAKLDSQRHIRWYRRLSILFTLPRGSTILDYGGGYGMDSIFLASLGYRVIFYELTSHHIGIARWFAERFAATFGELPLTFCLIGVDERPSGLDAMLANEAAHHIEPAQRVFDEAAQMLRPGGHLFLLEPNYISPMTQFFFLRGRGFQTTKLKIDETTGQYYLWGNEHIRPIWVWNRFAHAAEFALHDIQYILPSFSGQMTEPTLSSRQGIEKLPLVRDVLASHVGLHYKLKPSIGVPAP
jgi:SAM-dependent methyltransferase